MGFRPEPRKILINFEEGHDYYGVEVQMKSLTIRQYTDMFAETDNAKLIQIFAAHLVSWNVEDADGAPVPATLEGVDSQDTGLIVQLISAWQQALVTAPPTSPRQLPNGDRSRLADLASLSQSLPT
jgi:hypothetical protein